MRPGGVAIAVAVALVAAGLAGCVAAPVATHSADAALNPWERGLATTATTPEFAPRRSAADREAAVVPQGDPRYAAVDAVMAEFMRTNGVPTGTLALLRDGALRYEGGYGFMDEAATTPATPDTMMRIASVTKPITAALVALLVEEGRMAWDDPVFCLPPTPAPNCLLPIPPHPARPVADARLADVTLRDLVEHRTGWTRAECSETFANGMPVVIAQEFGIPAPAPIWRQAQWLMGTPMVFDPGTDPNADATSELDEVDTYCNLGYGILGLVAEAQTGVALPELYEAYLFRPLEVTGDVEPGRGRPQDRNPREPFYSCESVGPSAFEAGKEGCRADVGYDLEGMVAFGGLVATPAAVGAVYEVFLNDGSPRGEWLVHMSDHGGSISGTSAMARRMFVGGDEGFMMTAVVVFNAHANLAGEVDTSDVHEEYFTDLAAAFAAAESTAPAR